MSQAVEKVKHLTSELSTTKSSLAASQKDNETLRAQVTHTEDNRDKAPPFLGLLVMGPSP